jgi:hypothetical protein
VGVRVAQSEGHLTITQRGDSCAEGDTFEELVEDDDDGEGDEEGVSRYNKGDTDD